MKSAYHGKIMVSIFIKGVAYETMDKWDFPYIGKSNTNLF